MMRKRMIIFQKNVNIVKDKNIANFMKLSHEQRDEIILDMQLQETCNIYMVLAEDLRG